MNETLRDLAADASFYLQELRGHDIPYELTEILLRDWHAAQLQQSLFDPAATARAVRAELLKLHRTKGATG